MINLLHIHEGGLFKMQGFVTKIHHSGITVKNLDESVRFYEDVFGFKKIGGVDLRVEEEGDMKGVYIKIAFLKVGKDDLELLEYTEPKKKQDFYFHPWDTGVQHISFSVNNVKEFYEKYKDSIKFLTPPVDYITDEIDTTWTYLKDPNGSILELSEDHKERKFIGTGKID